MTSDHPTSADAPLELSATDDEVDYWGFVQLARRRLAEELEDVDLQANLGILALNRASGTITYDLESTIHRPQGLSWAAYRILFVLWNAGETTACRLAELTNMTRAAVSNLAKSLEAKGWIERRRDTEDRRSVRLRLTETGTERIRQAFLENNRREAAWMSGLTDVEQQLLIQLLRKLMEGREVADFATRY